MESLSNNFKYKQGKKIGYNISMPDQYGNSFVVENVSYFDKNRIEKEITSLLLELESNDPFYIFESTDIIVERFSH